MTKSEKRRINAAYQIMQEGPEAFGKFLFEVFLHNEIDGVDGEVELLSLVLFLEYNDVESRLKILREEHERFFAKIFDAVSIAPEFRTKEARRIVASVLNESVRREKFVN